MFSSVLRSKRAIQVKIEIMRAFIRLQQILASNADLARKVDAVERIQKGETALILSAKVHQR